MKEIPEEQASIFDAHGAVRDLRDVRAAVVARDEAIATVDAANTSLVERALAAVRAVAKAHDLFTTDDVWALLDADGGEPRAMGAAMRRAAAEGVCEATLGFRLSARPVCHRRPMREWRSLLR